MKIIPLSEGAFTIDTSKLFVPFNTETDDLQTKAPGSLLVEIQPFVVITSEDVLLLDTGLGFEKDGLLQIHQNMEKNGINPSDITKVLVTHLHKDHAGGIIREGLHRKQELAFPEATYYVQQGELNFAFEKGYPSYISQELECLKAASNVTLLEGDGTLNGYIKYQVTGAHCPYHQVFWIVDGGEKVFFGGDDAPQLHQMKNRFVAKYDFDGKNAWNCVSSGGKTGAAEKWTFLFYHDIKTPVYTF